MKIDQLMLVIALTGCAVPQQDERNAVPEQNELGVVAVETARFADQGDEVFELRGLDAHDAEVARVRMRIGRIEDLSLYVPGASVGTEIVLTSNGEDERMISAEQNVHVIALVRDPSLRQVLGLPSVAAVLDRAANITVQIPKQTGNVENGYNYASCPASYMLTSPLAQKCCHSFDGDWNTFQYQLFVRADGAVVYRPRSVYETGCKAEDGVSSCSGAACFYGPNAHARATIYPSQGTARIFGVGDRFGAGECNFDWSGGSSTFGDKTGTYPTGQGCPGGGTGAGEWDY